MAKDNRQGGKNAHNMQEVCISAKKAKIFMDMNM